MSMFPRLNAIIDKLAGLVHDKHEDIHEKVKAVRETIHEDRARRYDIPTEYVVEKMDELAKADPANKNWRESIVARLKLLGLDSSKPARAELADELGYKGEFTGSADDNVWLGKAVAEALETRDIALPYR